MHALADLFVNDLPRPAEPIAVAFVHGYLGLLARPYWIGCSRLIGDLRRRGVEVGLPQVGVTDRVADRARAVAAAVDRLGADRVVLVGHSMGGLDARYVASWLDPTRRISDVITLGTPHRGTYAADLAERLGRRLPAVLGLLDRGGLADLTRAAGERLALDLPDRADVRYRSICGRIDPAAIPMPFQVLAQRLCRHDGDNDGLVPVHSARWGEAVVVDDADHWSLIGLDAIAGPSLGARLARLRQRRARPVGVLRAMLRETLGGRQPATALRT